MINNEEESRYNPKYPNNLKEGDDSYTDKIIIQKRSSSNNRELPNYD